jgi:ComEC/Rec2-related protein
VCVGEVLAWFLAPLVVLASVGGCGVAAFAGGIKRGGALAGLCVGLAIGGWELVVHPPAVSGSDVEVVVHVEDAPRRRVPGEVVFLGRELLGGAGRLIRCRAIDLPWRGLSDLESGDVVWVRGPVVPLIRPLNPFSWEGWLWRRGISGEMKVLFGSRPLTRSKSGLLKTRRAISDAVFRATDEGRGGALFLSMAFGVRDVLSPPVEDLFVDLGLSHLLVVSGYQVSLVFGSVLAALLGISRAICPSLRGRVMAVGISLVCATLYVAAIGAEMSSVRALLAAVCLCVSLIMGRRHRFAQRLLVTLLCMHLLWPWAMFEVGVVLTFAALAGIGIGSTIGARSRWRTVVWVTACVWVLTSAVTVVWNGTFSVVALPLNAVLAAPWSVLNCTVGVAGLALLMTGIPGAELPVRWVGVVNEAIVSALFNLHGLVGASRELTVPERSCAAFVFLAAFGAILRSSRSRRLGIAMRAMVRGGSKQEMI